MINSSTSIWNKEYSETQAIPSSTREAPSQALLLFAELLSFRNMKRVLDAGCGNGRNSIYLASLGLQVDAVDYSPVAISEVERKIEENQLTGKVNIWERNLDDPFPFASNTFDLCLDFYVFCHFQDEQLRRHYINELCRVTKPGGYTLSVLFSPEDEYYKRVALPIGENIVKDPANNVVKVLYTKDSFRQQFSPPFKVEYFTEFEFKDLVQNKKFRRDILVMALKKPK